MKNSYDNSPSICIYRNYTIYWDTNGFHGSLNCLIFYGDWDIFIPQIKLIGNTISEVRSWDIILASNSAIHFS